MSNKKLPKLSELDKPYQEFIFCILRSMSKPETESEYHRQIVAGLNFDGLWKGERPIKNIPTTSGVFLRGCSGKFHRVGLDKDNEK